LQPTGSGKPEPRSVAADGTGGGPEVGDPGSVDKGAGVRDPSKRSPVGEAGAQRTGTPLTRAQTESALRDRFPSADSGTIQSHLDAVDLSHPVESVKLKAGDRVDVWVRDGGKPGAYGTTPGTSTGLGLPVDPKTGLPLGRHLEQFVLTEDVTVVRSTAADYAAGRVPGVGGSGGSPQYLLPSDFTSKAKRVP